MGAEILLPHLPQSYRLVPLWQVSLSCSDSWLSGFITLPHLQKFSLKELKTLGYTSSYVMINVMSGRLETGTAKDWVDNLHPENPQIASRIHVLTHDTRQDNVWHEDTPQTTH
ncbi:hypothetical protein AWV80_10495 [Cupriavidus sp. UYMU48A]|nr:hypothetical protein AWV80_10495 [Cupriavidus sp. UYMU48A]